MLTRTSAWLRLAWPNMVIKRTSQRLPPLIRLLRVKTSLWEQNNSSLLTMARKIIRDKEVVSLTADKGGDSDEKDLLERIMTILNKAEEGEGTLPIPEYDKKHYLLPNIEEMNSILKLRRELDGEMAQKRIVGKKKLTPWERLRSYFVKNVGNETINGGGVLQDMPTATRSMGKKVFIVGVHGWFPNRFLQTIIGVPKGTSQRLVRMMTDNVGECAKNNRELFIDENPSIESIALEGEGCIEERVQMHYEQLEKEGAMQKLREADSIIFAAHSQGAPVTSILMSRLLSDGLIDGKRQCIGFITMAGVFHGPFPYLRENLVVKYVEADAARELFDLNNGEGPLSKQVTAAINQILSSGVAINCVGSWLDQVVPVYSSLLVGIDHPSIWRSIYIDAHNYSPDFLSSLVSFTLKMVNARVDGSRELLSLLSSSLAGSLYQSNAHSTLYHDHGVYQNLIQWMTHLPSGSHSVPPKIMDEIDHELNPFMIPWLMRGLEADNKVMGHPDIKDDYARLKDLLRKWKPSRKPWKDLKMHFSPLNQSKL